MTEQFASFMDTMASEERKEMAVQDTLWRNHQTNVRFALDNPSSDLPTREHPRYKEVWKEFRTDTKSQAANKTSAKDSLDPSSVRTSNPSWESWNNRRGGDEWDSWWQNDSSSRWWERSSDSYRSGPYRGRASEPSSSSSYRRAPLTVYSQVPQKGKEKGKK